MGGRVGVTEGIAAELWSGWIGDASERVKRTVEESRLPESCCCNELHEFRWLYFEGWRLSNSRVWPTYVVS